MLDLKTRPLSMISNWDVLRDVLGTYGPESLQEIRRNALARFEEAGLPTTKHEEYRYVSLRALEEAQWKPAYGAVVDRQDLTELPLANLEAITVAIVNGEFAPELSSAHTFPAGVFIGSLNDAWGVCPDILHAYLRKIATLQGKLGTTNDERFVDLNTAYLAEGAVVYVPKGVAIEEPIHVLHIAKADHGPMALYPRTLLVMDERSEAKVVESYLGMQGVYFTNAVTEAWLAKDAILEHTKFQHEAADAVHIATIAVHQEPASTYTSNVGNFGGKIVRNDINVFVAGEHAETWLNGASVGLGKQVVDNHTRIDHAVPNCHSYEVYKSILGGKAQGVFNGKIFVYADAQKTDAKQSNQALLLSPQAAINTKPQLEIFADDVKCTHGATVGQLREDALFYLRARGVPKDQADALLVYAFAAEVLEKITIKEVREGMEQVLFKVLNEGKDLMPLDE